ncbi:hypothetical protein C8F01DRAFT_1086679 [Mycena amicta]|nr:hypothetical protein C8F01DRAFT_1086679 [Mycena amicta]
MDAISTGFGRRQRHRALERETNGRRYGALTVAIARWPAALEKGYSSAMGESCNFHHIFLSIQSARRELLIQPNPPRHGRRTRRGLLWYLWSLWICRSCHLVQRDRPRWAWRRLWVVLQPFVQRRLVGEGSRKGPRKCTGDGDKTDTQPTPAQPMTLPDREQPEPTSKTFETRRRELIAPLLFLVLVFSYDKFHLAFIVVRCPSGGDSKKKPIGDAEAKTCSAIMLSEGTLP